MVIVNKLEELDLFAKKFSEKLVAGNVILLQGDLGAGKTTFVQYLCKHLGYQNRATSPTFSLLNVYESVIPIYHFDLYRLKSEAELEEIGFFEAINSSNIVCVEWAMKFPSQLPENSYLLSFRIAKNSRIIEESVWSYNN